MEKKLSSSMEDYLEAIINLKKENGVARVSDIARLMGVKKPSVTYALGFLSENGFIIHERYGYVEFTLKGEKKALDVLRRHKALVKFLTKILNVHPEIAAEDACRMEHVVSSQTLEKITKFIDFVETCPDHDRPDWLESFDYYFETGKRPECKVRELKKEILNK